ncbi:alpha/beta hydrolase, partial [Klebsiella oxytoca]
MKDKILKTIGAAAAVFGIFMAFGWSFFDLMIHCRNKRQP